MLGAIEAGGTKFVCAVGDENFNIIERVSFPTTSPEEVMERIFEFFDKYKDLKSIGIGSFGPIDVVEKSKTYGYITTTPKKGWNNFDFLGTMKKHYDFPIGWTTDVNASCIAEYNMEKIDSCLYLTVGTGIGGGAIFDGKFVGGFGHPEMGHILVRKHPNDNFDGVCPYHGDCLEGLASGPAIEKRYGVKAEDLSPDHEIWDILAYYLAQALMSYTLILRPERIVIGGGVMLQPHMLGLIRKEFSSLLAEYVEVPALDNYIVSPRLGDNAGIIGGLILAKESLERI